MPKSTTGDSLLIDKIGTFAVRFEEIFETRFERVARDPRVLAFFGSSLNFASALRLESQKLETEVASFRTRAKLAFLKPKLRKVGLTQ
jgi:pantoate kinase